jgi:hypothetical protein
MLDQSLDLGAPPGSAGLTSGRRPGSPVSDIACGTIVSDAEGDRPFPRQSALACHCTWSDQAASERQMSVRKSRGRAGGRIRISSVSDRTRNAEGSSKAMRLALLPTGEAVRPEEVRRIRIEPEPMLLEQESGATR